ncbi:hypothetical protein [Pseudomonas syringae]|uniref:hypothetical protein n=3 Tax=Pseudomonas syringae TaxID=317 RepID=UPI0018E5FC9C|nr:hypothetical protein [Pseudomonas syringae]MBI6748183.1 hypothetical protein [Pseudomonas syringae]MBI6758730.1 hypothetical protein [Pseudomonas syringae]MBI6828043.1 hypothetical protein [Pseudomonas syringae]MCF5736610.1 hypothetical protein [Pseudomonas syringae]MCF5740945.1 hypothetical protein [Pseudomonas syringae]
MPNIYRVAKSYNSPFDFLNTTGESALRCRKIDLYRSIITVGSPSFLSGQDIRSYGFARVLYSSIIRKIAIVAVNIKSDIHGIRRHPIFDTHITDDKRIVSYNLGMTFAKFYSEKLLGVPNLIHLEYLKKQNAVTFAPQIDRARSREPDLVGQTPDGNWHVFEAKGISSSTSQLNSKILEAKDQVRQVKTIHGMPPSTGTACATHIGPDRILTYLEDPSADDGKQVNIDQEKFIKSYYAPFLLAGKFLDRASRHEQIDGLDVEFYDLDYANIKLSIGIDREVLDLVKNNTHNLPNQVVARLREYAASDDKKSKYSIGLDGFVVGYTNH